MAVIEIVVTHSPEPDVKTYYEKQLIPIALFCLQSDEDLNRLDASILVPNELDLCINPRCQKCDRFMKNREIWIQRSACWKCHSTMVVAAVDERDAYRGLTCNFSSEELQWLKEKGANIERRYSKTTRESYFANVCMRCKSFIGNHYLFTQYFGGVDPDETVQSGHHCPDYVMEADLGDVIH